MTCTIGIVGGGPRTHIPSLKQYTKNIDVWIGADAGAVSIVEQGIQLEAAIGDFDSVSEKQLENIHRVAKKVYSFPKEKDETDLELAVNYALERKPHSIIFFGVTGGRLDHTLSNIQFLYTLLKQNVHGKVIDTYNEVELFKHGTYTVKQSTSHPYISFIPMSERVINLTLEGFYYPLSKETIHWGSTLCLSNKLLSENGTFLFDDGILILIKSRDQILQSTFTN